MEIHSHGISTFFVLANILQIELLIRARLLFLGRIGIRNQRFPPLVFGQDLEQVDDLVQFRWITGHRAWKVRAPTGFVISTEENASLQPDRMPGFKTPRIASVRVPARTDIAAI